MSASRILQSRIAPDSEQFSKNLSLDSLSLIGAAWDLGAPRFGSSMAADTFFSQSKCQHYHWHKIGKKQGFLRNAHSLNCNTVIPQIIPLCLRLARQVTHTLKQHKKFAVIGGDHSCAIGSWHGVAHALGNDNPFGMIWLDAHLDAHTPHTSQSMQLHGMPLAILLGLGDRRLTRLSSADPVLYPEFVSVVGVRSYEAEEFKLLQQLGVRIFSIQEIQQRGLITVLSEALDIASSATGKFGISIDLDVLDPGQVPGINTPEAQGLSVSSLSNALLFLNEHPGLLGAEIAEFNPLLDKGKRTVKAMESLLFSIFPELEEVEHDTSH